ncbi:MAG TPA: NPCBM/NEW2 domain-containing protein, partial [Sedimentisphaerales bacterium]|nr:NPCBM/NEW2 domain-containing protein [Sedimentisphaerales bacterium]
YVGGDLSKEKTAEGAIDAFEGFHKANPDVWRESTCFGWHPSPWWLFYVESMVGCYGDDAPLGQVPCPVYRESFTTGRDFYNLQGAALMPVPVAAHDLMGIVHQDNNPFMNDAVTCLMRGNKFVQFYFNPKYMDKFRWQQLSDVMNWARKNSEIITGQTQPLLPQSWQNGSVPQFTDLAVMPREPYGYAHWQEDKGLVLIRNPWITSVTYTLKLNGETELSPKFKNASVVGLYPEPRLYAKDVKFGDGVAIDLAPYETVVLSIAKNQETKNLPAASDCIGGQIKANVIRSHVLNVDFTGSKEAMGDNWINRIADAKKGTKVTLEAELILESSQNKFLLLLEGQGKSPVYALGKFIINGKQVLPRIDVSEEGWRTTWIPDRETWTFVEVPLEKGKNTISVEAISSECTNVSAWVWATKAGGEKAGYSNSITNPEFISLDSIALIRPTDMKYLGDGVSMEMPVDVVNGIYLDALKPVSVSQGYCELSINKNIADGKPLQISKKKYVRGLCTHANSKIVYDLDGKYSRFQSWVGVDWSVYGSVTFEVYVDGKKIYNSLLMEKSEFIYPTFVDVDIKGCKKLELVVTDGGNGINADHANWAEARLLE